MDPVTIRTRRPVHPDQAHGALQAETDRWGMYGDVLACGLDPAGHPTTIVAPRTAGPAIALAAAVAAAHRHGTHDPADQEHTA